MSTSQGTPRIGTHHFAQRFGTRRSAIVLCAAGLIAACATTPVAAPSVDALEDARVGFDGGNVVVETIDGATPRTEDAALDAATVLADASPPKPDAQTIPDAGGGPPVNCVAPKIRTNHACGQWRAVGAPATPRAHVWANTPNDVWTVGKAGVISRWNGTAFVNMPSGVTTDLYGVWGTSANDVWVVGASAVTRHWDGTAWESRPVGLNTFISGIHGTAPDDVWAVGADGYAHWTGRSWILTSVRDTVYYSVWMASSAFGVKVGENGFASSLPLNKIGSPPNGAPNFSVWGTSPTDFWTGNRRGDIFHWDGRSWVNAHSDTILYQRRWMGIWGAFADDVWVVGDDGWSYHWDGLRLNEVRIARDDFSSISGTSADNIWAVSEAGSVWRFSP